MNDNKKVFIKRYLEKAQEALEDAEFNVDNDKLSTALNRIYYSIFYSISALAYLKGFTTSKHFQLMGWFNKNYIHDNKVFEDTLYKVYKEAYENRQESDYSLFFDYDKDEIFSNLNNAKKFVKEVSSYILKHL